VQEDTLAIVDSRFKAGVSSELDTSQAKAQLDVRRSQVPPLRTSIEQTIHRLSVLIGQSPAALQQELRPEADIPMPPERVSVGVPSELLLRRPDVRRAERRIAAATARVGVAEADFFPRFTLTAGLGLESDQIGDFPDMNSRYWSIGPGMRWPIFNAGRIQFNVEAQRAVVDQVAAAYEGVVLSSFEEVENALVELVQEQARFSALNDAVIAAKRSVELADERYRAGTVDFRTVLENQRTLYETEDQMVQSRRSVSTSVITLYKALGGGWEIDALKEGKRPDSETERPANPATRAGEAPPEAAPADGSAE
jgi:NodT family efflux transporter outer membrane factor (OMF) lipoprotein